MNSQSVSNIMEGVRYTNNNRVFHKSIDASNSRAPKQQQGLLVMPLTSWMQATARKPQQGSHSRDASKSSLASNSRDTSNSSELGKIGDLSNDRKASNSMALVISNSRNGSQSKKARNLMDATKNRNTSNSRKAMAVAENISNNRDSNIVIGKF